MSVKLLIVTKSTGGLATYNYRFCERIDRDRFDITVVCLSDNKEVYARELEEIGIKTVTMDMNRYKIDLFGDAKLALKLVQYVKDRNFDLLLGHGTKSGFLVRLVERFTGVPSIYALASMSFVERIHGRKAKIYRILERLGVMLGGHIVTVAEATRRELLNYNIGSGDKITAIHTGIDLSQWTPVDSETAKSTLGLDPSRPVVGWAARFEPQKAPLDYIEAAAHVCDMMPDVQFFMAGEGAMRDDVKKAIAAHNLEDHFLITPWQSDVPTMLSAFDVYLLTSRWEGLPQSLLEAMAIHLPSIVTEVDGNPEVIEHGVSGYLVPAGDTAAMASYMVELLQNDEQREAMRLEARKRIENAFTVEQMMASWEALLIKAAQGKL